MSHPLSTPTAEWSYRKEKWSLDCHNTSIPISRKCTKTILEEVVLTTAHKQITIIKSPMRCFLKSILTLVPHTIPKLLGCGSFVYIHSQKKEARSKSNKMCFSGVTRQPKRDRYKCYHPPSRKFLAAANVTFAENKSYFTEIYLQRENIFVEANDRYRFLLELPLPSQF